MTSPKQLRSRRRKRRSIRTTRQESTRPVPTATTNVAYSNNDEYLTPQENQIQTFLSDEETDDRTSISPSKDTYSLWDSRRCSSHSIMMRNHPQRSQYPCRYLCTRSPTVSVSPATNSSYTPLPLAVYHPAYLFSMLFIASILPKNAFSFRWLTWSSYYSNAYSHGLCGVLMRRQHCVFDDTLMDSQPGLWFLSELSLQKWVEDSEMNEKLNNLQYSLEKDMICEISAEEASLISKKLYCIPRGGDLSPSCKHAPNYSGLLNLGNTCYLNAQLQCAYHVPFLRQLILEAKDKVPDFDIEKDLDDDESRLMNETYSGVDTNGPNDQDNVSFNNEKSMKELHDPIVPVEKKKSSIDTSYSVENVHTSKRNDLRVDVRTEHGPISHALRALQQTFLSLEPGTNKAGSTEALCRSLGINPFIQQDGQEFWKLLLPEINCPQLTQLYTGFYDDYIREITPVNEIKVHDPSDFWEEKKDDDEVIYSTVSKPRERIRTDPFLDLSIPVTEGTGCSVESSLKEMFSQPEILRVSEGNGWRPSKDAGKVDAYKGLSLKSQGLPSLLQLHLKRFKYDWETGKTSKINNCCTFPLELDLSEIVTYAGMNQEDQVIDETMYDLQSIVIHKGEYGHYYSYVRPNIRTNEWYRFDDEFSTSVDYKDVIADAYGGISQRKRSNSSGGEVLITKKQSRGLLRRILSYGGFGRGRNAPEFGYGGQTSSAYMLQYVRRLDVSKLYPE